VRDALEKLAADRLARFSHVGVAERLRESAEAAAATLGLDLKSGTAYGRPGSALDYDDYDDEGEEEENEEQGAAAATSAAAGGTDGSKNNNNNKPPKFSAQVQPLPLGQAFLKCAARYREADKRSARAAMESVPVAAGAPPARPFGGDAPPPPPSSSSSSSSAIAATAAVRRAMIPPELITWLRDQNRMDARLHALAVRRLDEARARLGREGRLEKLSAEEERAAQVAAQRAAAGPLLKAMQGQVEQVKKQQQQQQQQQFVV
jgi:hypothetical protein